LFHGGFPVHGPRVSGIGPGPGWYIKLVLGEEMVSSF
jgi:hypothetical protein